MKLLSHNAKFGIYWIDLAQDEYIGMTGRAYIKKRMKSVAPNWPHESIHIMRHTGRWSPSIKAYKVSFRKKAAEYEIMFKMLLD